MINAGGQGTRLWPMSRQHKPKQLFDLVTNNSMLQDTVTRFKPDFGVKNIFINTSLKYKAEIEAQFPKFPHDNIIYEPGPRNTSGAIAFSTAYAYYRDPNAVVAFLPADHVIKKEKQFIKDIKTAGKIAQKHQKIVLLGINPTYPAIEYGYINMDKPLKENGKNSDAYIVKSFVEKPDLTTAKRYLKSWRYLWNAGMFIAPVKVMMKAFKTHLPTDFKIIEKLIDCFGKKNEAALIKKYHAQLTSVAIDYSIMEKEKELLVLPVDIEWNDIGTMSVLKDVLAENEKDNITKGEVIDIDTQNCLIYGSNRLIATLGLKDTIIVDTEDALMICAKDKSAEMKKIIEKLKENKLDRYL